MQTSTRVVLNTVVLYIKVVLSLVLALISVPLVLNALGASDYGLYNLVAGVVAMLSFLNNSMTVSSQRFMSVSMGEGDESKINSIYNTSFLLHFCLAVLIVVAFEIIGIFAVDKLNILPERMWCAKIIYQLLILSTFANIIAVPFDALTNAKEDMIPFSVIELFNSLLMLAIALSITCVHGDRLIYYGACVSLIAVITLLLKYGWCRYAYKNLKINIRAHKDKLKVREMLGFTSWNLFAGLAMIGRNQGVAIIINLFLGTVVNAAYGIANQVNGALSHFSATFQKAINPQLMKSEGMNDRERLLRISFISSKFSVLAIAFFAVPLIMEMEEVLIIWLKEGVPPFTMRLTQFILLLSLTYQYSVGIMSAIQAAGKIRNYQILMGTILLTNIPIAYLILKYGFPVYYTAIAFVILEVLSLCVRLLMANKLTGMNITDYCRNVLLPTLIIILVPMSLSLVPHLLMPRSFLRLVVVCLLYCPTFAILMYRYAFDENQRLQISSKVKHLFNR